MIAIIYSIGIFMAAIFSILLSSRQLIGKEIVGTVEAFRLTWMLQGQQILTIDGKNYSVWLNYRDFDLAESGNVIRHRPYWAYMDGKKLLSTKIIAVEKKNNNATHTESGSQIPS